MNTTMAIALIVILALLFMDTDRRPHEVNRQIESYRTMTTEVETDVSTGRIFVTTVDGYNICVTTIEKSREYDVYCQRTKGE